MNEELYRLEAVSYTYNAQTALRDLTFTVSQGESIAVLGANGSGKSTLLKILNRLIYPTSGAISYMGVSMSEAGFIGSTLKCFRERVGFVFSEPDVQLFCPTVFDEVVFGPLQLGLSSAEAAQRSAELLSMLGISGLKDRPPYTLSTGEKKKVAIASVLANNPDVLLLDEPTNGLDPRTQVWLFELIESLKGLNKTCIMSTHDLSLVEDLATRTLVLDESHSLAADGPSRDILSNKDLLLAANIIHEHTHRHGDVVHIHSHGPFATHDEHD
ncbi:MAG: hypothetical protein A3J24_03895 [Deltaproteobacteria bacterium RIFCSPLOWO2_02_FULL_53_8]|nr:MAG: hypothetical protein A3J24_03895 [Deltaproteobacteria bacterium RIFCSPLOWO2_02_FULL_53_8]